MEEAQAAEEAAQPGQADAPCSRYGRSRSSWFPVAYATAVIVCNETDGDWAATLYHCISLVVNDHDDPEYMLRNYGADYGFAPEDFLP
jgi:hypothetical protein